jgi:hypothetical protein
MPNYDTVYANIWLTEGDHFFFYCDHLLNPEDVSNISQNLCQLASMQRGYTTNDNVKITISALGCTDYKSLMLKKS